MKTFKDKYNQDVVGAFLKDHGVKNPLQVPRLVKITLNVGVGRAAKDPDFLNTVEQTLTRITGQKPVRTKAKKSIAGFKIREGAIVGMKVTLRKQRMNDFLEKMLVVTFPRVRDFHGINASAVDQHGNMTVGFKENLPFPEVRADEIERIHGLEVTITTTAGTRERGETLFRLLGFPFKK